MFPYREYHEAGALLSYSVDAKQAFQRMATHVDKILKGANPAELPIEQISTYEMIIDLRIAREMHILVSACHRSNPGEQQRCVLAFDDSDSSFVQPNLP